MRAVSNFKSDSFVGDPPSLEVDGVSQGRARIEKTFTGEIEGHGSVEMLAARADAGSGYVALERITGSVNGRVGGFSLLHIGTLTSEEMWALWRVVPGSGTGELRTIRGEGTIEIDANGVHTFTLEYELD